MFPINSISKPLKTMIGKIDDTLGATYKFTISIILKSSQPYYRRASSYDCDCYYRMPEYILLNNNCKKNVYWERFYSDEFEISDGDLTRITFSDLQISNNNELTNLCIDIEYHLNHMSLHWTNTYTESSLHLAAKSRLLQILFKPYDNYIINTKLCPIELFHIEAQSEII